MLCSPLPLVLMFFKLEKKAKKKENTWKIKKQNFKTEKNRKQNKWENKGTSKRVKKWEKNGLVHLHFCCFFFAFSICFLFAFFCLYFAFFCFLPGKKQKKSKQKANRKSKKNANGQVHFFPIFSPFCLSFSFPFFPFILLLCFLDFADLLFVFSICFAFFALFFKF